MALPAPRRLPFLGLLAACLAVLPFLRDHVGHSAGFLPASLSVAVVCDLLTAGLLAVHFRARGSAPLLLLACAYLFAGAIAAVHALVLPDAFGLVTDAGSHAPAWLWAIGHAGLPLALAFALLGGPPGLRRRLAAPTTRRGRAVGVASLLVSGAVGALTWALVAAGSALPDVTHGHELSELGLIAGPIVLGLDLAALVIVARRGRRSTLERRLLIVVACSVAGTALTLAAAGHDTVGWYAANLLELAASAVMLVTLLADVGRLGGFAAADRRAGATEGLTGVLTRPAALVAAEHLHVTRAPGTPIGLALVDVDGLKRIGDAHGQLAADAVLLTVAVRLRAELRDEDVLGRAGEDGFLVVLPGTDADGVTQAIDRAVAAIREQPVGTWAHDVRTTASGGIAMVGEGEDAIAEALAAAELALNQAKAHGRNQVVSPARGQVVPLRRAAAGPPPG
jgi:diguanylate cyclase (GGDEF)-like protein